MTHALRLSLDRARSTTTLELSGTTLTSVYTFSDNDPALAAGNLFGGTTQLSSEGRAQLSLRNVVRSDSSTLVAGIDLAHGAGRVDDGITPSSLGFAQTAAYAQESLTAHDGARLDLGLRAERDGAYGGIFAPSLGARIPLGGGLALRANFSTGFRAPDVTDLIYPDVLESELAARALARRRPLARRARRARRRVAALVRRERQRPDLSQPELRLRRPDVALEPVSDQRLEVLDRRLRRVGAHAFVPRNHLVAWR